MKNKLYNLLAIAAIALCLTTFTSCGLGTSAADKALEILGDLKEGDYDDYASNIHTKESATEQDVEQLSMMLETKGQKVIEDHQGIDSYEVVNEEPSDDGQKATVTMKVTYGNGEVKEYKMKMVKDSDGEWKHKLI